MNYVLIVKLKKSVELSCLSFLSLVGKTKYPVPKVQGGKDYLAYGL